MHSFTVVIQWLVGGSCLWCFTRQTLGEGKPPTVRPLWMCSCARPGLGFDLGGIQTFLPRHRTDHASTGFETGVPGQRKKNTFKYYIFHKQPFSPLSQHLGHVVLLHVKDDLNKQASVVSTTTCRIIFLHNPKNHGISKLVVWRS